MRMRPKLLSSEKIHQRDEMRKLPVALNFSFGCCRFVQRLLYELLARPSKEEALDDGNDFLCPQDTVKWPLTALTRSIVDFP